MPAVKMSVSFSPYVKELAETRARQQDVPLSRYLADLVEQDAMAARDALAAEGYRLMADEMHELSELGVASASDWLPE